MNLVEGKRLLDGQTMGGSDGVVQVAVPGRTAGFNGV